MPQSQALSERSRGPFEASRRLRSRRSIAIDGLQVIVLALPRLDQGRIRALEGAIVNELIAVAVVLIQFPVLQ